MRKFDNIRLSVKLPAMLVLLSILVATGNAGVGFFQFRQVLIRDALTSLSDVAESHQRSLEASLDNIRQELLSQASSPQTAFAISRFTAAASQLEGDIKDTLQSLYIDNNPNETGAKHLLERADDTSAYSVIHGQYHPYFRDLMETFGYYDVFLINPEGTVIYTVYKEADYATNLERGAYATTGLGRAFRAARDGGPGQVHFVDFEAYAPSMNAPTSFIAAPVQDGDGEFVGVLAYQMPVERLMEVVSTDTGLGETGDAYLIGTDGRTRTPSRFVEDIGILDQLPDLPQVRAGASGESFDGSGIPGLNGQTVAAVSAPLEFLGTKMSLIVERDMSEIVASARRIELMLVIQIAICVMIVLFISLAVARTITIPLARVRDGMNKVADGEYDLNLRASDREDEIGDIAKALMKFRDKLIKSDEVEKARLSAQENQKAVVEQLSVSLRNLADGDLTRKLESAFPEEYEQLRADFNETIQTLRQMIETVVENASRINTGAGEISQASDDLSRRTETQAATLEETAAALDELTSSVNSAADGAREVETIVNDAKTHAEASGVVVQSAVSAMTEIEKSSEQISQIIGVIDDIAFQTNLLALNAGVEAARAGEAGKGFAVVASEVRALAQRSSDAAKEIKSLISGSSHQVEEGVTLVGKAGEALVSIVERVNHISDLVTEITRGTVEQATGLAEINTGVTNLDQVTQQNAAMVEQSTAAAHSLSQEARELSDVVARFRVRAGDDVSIRTPLPMAVGETTRSYPAPAPVTAADSSDVWQNF
ncbi:methyl-accepting chemotaxis protein [Pelagovum pacificum]|nr:methyl-accepting chemotaxis protein [Pelagovum pacificum]QQA41888.1 methyl-accepting chemotaxis protein [Pelagovum pacificum]